MVTVRDAELFLYAFWSRSAPPAPASASGSPVVHPSASPKAPGLLPSGTLSDARRWCKELVRAVAQAFPAGAHDPTALWATADDIALWKLTHLSTGLHLLYRCGGRVSEHLSYQLILYIANDTLALQLALSQDSVAEVEEAWQELEARLAGLLQEAGWPAPPTTCREVGLNWWGVTRVRRATVAEEPGAPADLDSYALEGLARCRCAHTPVGRLWLTADWPGERAVLYGSSGREGSGSKSAHAVECR